LGQENHCLNERAPARFLFLKRVGKKRFSAVARIFLLCPPPYFQIWPPWILCFGWAKAHRCPPKSLNVKRELFIYHNTILFFHKIQGGQSSPKLFPKREIQGWQCPRKLFPGWAHAYAHPAHPGWWPETKSPPYRVPPQRIYSLPPETLFQVNAKLICRGEKIFLVPSSRKSPPHNNVPNRKTIVLNNFFQ